MTDLSDRDARKRKPLSVLMLTPELPPPGANMTGSPAHVYKLSRELASAGVSVTHFAIDRSAGAGRQGKAPGIAGRMRQFFMLLKKNRPDVLHCHGHKAAFLAMLLAKPLGIPVVCELHGYFNPSAHQQAHARPLLSKLLKLLEVPTLRRVDHIIAQSQSMNDFVREQTGCPSEKITVFYPGLNVAEFSEYQGPAAVIQGVAPATQIILYAGSTYAYQGLELLAKAQALFVESHPDALFVLVISSGGSDARAVVEQYGFLPRWTKVVDLDDSAQLPAYLTRADVLVHTRPDTLDNLNVQSKLGLYLAARKPIVTTNVGDYPFILSGSGGCLVTDPEEYQIALALAEAVDSPEVASYARVDNPALANRFFDSRNNVNRLISLYQRVRHGSSFEGLCTQKHY